ncbi:MAG: hypothetical protein ACRCTQ_03745 [Brevinemataceae bacterium]
MNNKQYFFDTLQHRINIFHELSQNTQFYFLLPEIFIKTLRDFHRLTDNFTSHANCIEILEHFNIPVSEKEQILITNMEHSLRKAKSYEDFCTTCDFDYLKSTAEKIFSNINRMPALEI